jgi:hypothetical protein
MSKTHKNIAVCPTFPRPDVIDENTTNKSKLSLQCVLVNLSKFNVPFTFGSQTFLKFSAV